MKVVVFHPAIAPYRIDFFNSLNKTFDVSFYFEFSNVLEQDFNQSILERYLEFQPKYLKKKDKGLKNLRWDVLSILRKEKPDVVFCSEFNLLGVLVLLYKYLFKWNLKIVTICDDNVTLASSVIGQCKRLKKLLITCFDSVVLVSTDTLDWYKKEWKRVGKKFVYFPIIQKDEIFRKRLEEALPISRKKIEQYELINKKIVLFVGRLIDIKNLSVLIDAFSKIQKSDVRLVFVGEGNLEMDLKNKVAEKGLDRKVLFVGKQEGLDLFAWYNIGQVFVLPSYYERFGAVVNEALLSGCITICSEIAGASCLIKQGNNGFVFEPNDGECLYRYLQKSLQQTAPLQVEKELKPNKMLDSYQGYYDSFIEQLIYSFS